MQEKENNKLFTDISTEESATINGGHGYYGRHYHRRRYYGYGYRSYYPRRVRYYSRRRYYGGCY